MSGLPTLDPEIADLGLAIGLLSPSDSGVELDSTWFDDPGGRLSGTLADDGRRDALVRFADAVLGSGGQDTGTNGRSRIPLLDIRALANDTSLPDIVVLATLDATPSDWVEVGLAATLTTTSPASVTQVEIPIYRAAKTGKSVAQPFALLGGGIVTLSTELTLAPDPVPVEEFGLAGVSASVAVALSGGPDPVFALTLKGLHLPGAQETGDLAIGGGGQSLDQTLLSLVLGLVRQGVEGLSGSAADEVGALLDLLGMGTATDIPALPVEQVLADGVAALRAWAVDVVGTPAARDAWLAALGDVLGGTVSDGVLAVPVGGGGVTATVGLQAAQGPGGHLQVTPRLGLSLHADVAGAVRLGAEATADLLTIDVGTGGLQALPYADLVVTATGTGAGDAAKLLHTGTVDVASLRLGLALNAGHAQALIELLDVDVEGQHQDVLDLSSPDAVAAAAGHLADDLLAAALDALGDAGTALKGLLGLDPPAGVSALDGAHLLADPLGTVAGWWHDLLTQHPTAVPDVLAHLRDLVAGPTQVLQAVTGTGTADDPWVVPVINRLTLTCWLDGDRLLVAPALSLRVDDLAGGCTVVLTSITVQLASIDLAAGHAQFLGGVDLTARLRARGGTQARLSLGPVAIVADFLGAHAGWTPAAGLDVAFLAPNLALDLGSEQVPLVLPSVDAHGHVDVPTAAWASVERLVAVLASIGPRGWPADLVDLTGWGTDDPLLSLADLVADPGTALTGWLAALLSDGDLVGTLTSAVAHLTGGSPDGLAGAFTGSGTRDDPWVASLGTSLALPGLAVWLGPDGPVRAATMAGDSLAGWRPGTPGLDGPGLAQVLADEAYAGPDVAALAAGRDQLGTGLQTLADRWAGTDGLVAAPPTAITGLRTLTRLGVDAAGLAALDLASLVPGGLPAGAVVVRVAVGPVASSPWTADVGRLIDLTPPGLAPGSFSVATPASGEWVVALAPRADATLGASDPSGVLGQSARLQQVLGPLAAAGPVVLVALGGAGHAARLAADSVAGVTYLVTLGTPWSAVAFDTFRTGASADALRLLRVLLPAVDPEEPDDPDLALGRSLVSSAMGAVRGQPAIADLEAPRPTTPVRDGLTAVAVFGALDPAAIARAVTAVVAAGLSARAQARAAAAFAPPDTAYVGLRLPFALLTPPGGHGTTVSGLLLLTLATASASGPSVHATPALRLDLAVADTDGWLVGGPGTTPVAGALPLELRRLDVRVEADLRGGAASTEITLQEGSALGADWPALPVITPAAVSGAIEATPLLPEAQALLVALVDRLTSVVDASPAGVLLDLLRAAGVSRSDGAVVPDALTHLVNDPAAHLRALVGDPATRGALLAALARLTDAVTVDGDTVAVSAGPLALHADAAVGAVTATATGTDGLLHWQADVALSPTAAPSVAVTVGDPAADALALRLGTSGAQLLRAGASPVPLWPDPDVDGLAQVAVSAVPAEALRVVLEGLRSIDNQLGGALDDLMAALGLLSAPDGDGWRRVRAPYLLFADPVRWMRGSVLSLVDGGPYDTGRLVDLLEGLKPFVGLAGTPRGSWPVTDGVSVLVASGSLGPTVSLAVDATTWLAGAAGRAPFSAGASLGLELAPSAAPRPSVDAWLGVPDGPDGTSTPQHRSAAHLVVDASGIRVLLRPASGSDVEVFPTLSGLGALLDNVTQLLPKVLDEVAGMDGDATRTAIAELVGSVGRGLAVASGTPAVFDATALKSLAADPVGWLRAQLAGLLTQAVAALDPLLQSLLSLAPTQHVATLSGAGVLSVDFRTVDVALHPSPLAVHAAASATGLPVIDAVGLSLDADQGGPAGWSFAVGPATIDLGGPVVRPVLRGSWSASSGWEVQLGLGLDGLAPGADGHRELLARWRSADAALTIVATEDSGGSATEDTSPEGVAAAAVDAVLELVGTWVLGVDEVKTQLQTEVKGQTVEELLQGSILDPAAPVNAPRLVSDPLDGWPGKLLVLAGKVAGAGPSVTVGPFTIGLADNVGFLGVTLTPLTADGIDLNPGSDTIVTLEVDATWIDSSESPGVTLNLLRLDGGNLVPAPGLIVSGVGVRLHKSSDHLIDAGLILDSVAVHLFGSVQLGTGDHPQFGGGLQVELGGLAVPLGGGGGDNAVAQGIVHDAGGSGAPPRPAFSPSLAVQDHGSGIEVSLAAGSGDGPWFMPIQRAFGPVYLEQVGLGVDYQQGVSPRQLELISLYLDGSVSLLGLSASVDKLRLTYHVTRPFFDAGSWEVDVDGFAIASNVAGLTLAGGLRKFTLDAPLSGVEYLGMLKVGYGSYGIALFGGYAHPTTPSGAQFASFFAFGVLHAPIGGPPAFFITGIGIGFGINRELAPPDVATLDTNPFMLALRALGPTPDPMQQLQDMRLEVPPAQGDYWVAAGISFTSFVLITGEVLVTVQFGDGLDIAVLGLARAQLPTPVLTLVSIELALLARFSSKEGLLLVQAQLTENSWLLDKSVHLTGGFAFETWWKGPNAGQFVVTVGGYHPRFHHDGYPVVPRVGLNWSPIDNISVTGGVYFALCSEAIMAGAAMEVAAHFGPAHARLAFGGDAIVFFDPFWFSVDAYAEVDVGIRIDVLFGTIDVEMSFGVDVEVSGPPIYVTGHFSVCGFAVPFEFGDQGDPADNALDAPTFAQKYLRAGSDAQVVQAAVLAGAQVAGKSSDPGSGGVAKPPDGSPDRPFRVAPEFQLTFVSTAPTTTLVLEGGGATKSVSSPAPELGVAPMYSATLGTTLTLTLTSADQTPQTFDLTDVGLSARLASSFPKGVWGQPPNSGSPTVPAGETIQASDGLTIDTVIPDSVFTGAPPIDYHQIELPLAGRKPLPFITNRGNTDARVAAALALKAAAQVLDAGDPDTAERFSRAALVLAAGGSGLTTVASLRGARASAPTFGSLADDLVDSPDAVATATTPVVVDRSPLPPQRYNPLVKAVLGQPLSYSVAAPAATTVADSGSAVSRVVPTLSDVRAANASSTQASLTVIPRSASASGRTLAATGSSPLTRLASGNVGAVANARPVPQAAGRLAAMSDALLPASPTPAGPGARGAAAAAGAGGAVLHEGELAVLTIAQRPTGDVADQVVVAGGLTRVLCLAAGGRAVADAYVGADGAASASVALPTVTERVVVVAEGTQAGAGGSVAGWCAGQSLPSVGWGTALAGGAVLSAQGTRVPRTRERADGGWVRSEVLASAARVVTAFTDPVDVVAVVVDDTLGGDAASRIDVSLLDGRRASDASGAPLPPQVAVDGVRSILLYAVETTGPEPAVVVTGCGGGQLAGVLGDTGGVAALAALLAVTGVEAAVRQPLVGGPGQRQVGVVLGDGPVEDATPRTAVPRARRRTARRSR
ncbi:MAG TPA: DUF6603 domain-containing protein [Actinomycetes bacterium]|nr:DUF6603 domain-containing protein [Actinomycetes bacterium]